MNADAINWRLQFRGRDDVFMKFALLSRVSLTLNQILELASTGRLLETLSPKALASELV
jgi:hypothetical protein